MKIILFLISIFALIISTYTRRYIKEEIEKYNKIFKILSSIFLISLLYYNFLLIIFIILYIIILFKKEIYIIALQIAILSYLSFINNFSNYVLFSLVLLFIIFSSFSYTNSIYIKKIIYIYGYKRSNKE
ncbi:MAG: hypothetical protein ACP5GJ_01705 [Nanopusillaceae archaeon]|jgi:hypothetical protein